MVLNVSNQKNEPLGLCLIVISVSVLQNTQKANLICCIADIGKEIKKAILQVMLQFSKIVILLDR